MYLAILLNTIIYAQNLKISIFLQLTIHCGISGNATCIDIEKQSFNTKYLREDINLKQPNDNCCVLSDGNNCLKTKLDTETLCSSINSYCETNGLKARCEESNDPGQ